MRAMILEAPGRGLTGATLPDPSPGPGQVLVEVRACGVCRTDLHVVDGDLPFPGHRVVPGHEVVGRVIGRGPGAGRHRTGDRVGIPWLGWTCGACDFCRSGRENLCDRARFTGYHLDGSCKVRRSRAVVIIARSHACCRCTRSKSPRAREYRSRTYSSAWSPVSSW